MRNRDDKEKRADMYDALYYSNPSLYQVMVSNPSLYCLGYRVERILEKKLLVGASSRVFCRRATFHCHLPLLPQNI